MNTIINEVLLGIKNLYNLIINNYEMEFLVISFVLFLILVYVIEKLFVKEPDINSGGDVYWGFYITAWLSLFLQLFFNPEFYSMEFIFFTVVALCGLGFLINYFTKKERFLDSTEGNFDSLLKITKNSAIKEPTANLDRQNIIHQCLRLMKKPNHTVQNL